MATPVRRIDAQRICADLEVEVNAQGDSLLRLNAKVGDKPIVKEFQLASGAPWFKASISCARNDTLSIKILRGHRPLGSTIVRFKQTVAECLEQGVLKDDSKKMVVRMTLSAIETSGLARDQLGDALEDARARVEGAKVIKEKLGRVFDAMEFFRSIGGVLEDLHPAIKFVSFGLEQVIQACEHQEQCRDAAAQLLDQLDFFVVIYTEFPEFGRNVAAKIAVSKLLNLASEILTYVLKKTRPGYTGNLISSEYAETLSTFKRQFDEERSQFMLHINTKVYTAALREEEELLLREYLNPSEQAPYQQHASCMPGTRTDLLRHIEAWLEQPQAGATEQTGCESSSRNNLFWVTGLPGAGKSSIAGSVADMVASRTLGLTYFFCKRGISSLSSTTRIFPTLAYSFCATDNAYRSVILELLQPGGNERQLENAEREQLRKDDIGIQYQILFEKPLRTVAEWNPHVVVIDALDECTGHSAKANLAKHLVDLCRSAPWLKVFVTSRKESGLEEEFSSASVAHVVNISDSSNDGINDHDVQLYVKKTMRDRHVSPKTIDSLAIRLVKRAAGLFIYCSTLFKTLGDSQDTESDIGRFLSGTTGGEKHDPMHQVYTLYDQVLDSSTGASHDSKLRPRLVLGIILIASRPLSIRSIAELLRGHAAFEGIDCYQSVRNIVQRGAHALLYEDAGTQQSVRTHHPSILDYIALRYEKMETWPRLVELHRAMARGCLDVMNAQLKINICELSGPPVLNREIPDLQDRANRFISPELQYASQLWFEHLDQGGGFMDAPFVATIKNLLWSPKALFWLEVMSALNSVSTYSSILSQCSAQLKRNKPHDVNMLNIIEAADDLYCLVTSFGVALASIPHIYISALAWAPRKCWTSTYLAEQFKGLPLITAGSGDEWATSGGLVWSKGTDGPVRCLACSPDGRYIVTGHGSWDVTLKRWDMQTGEAVGEPMGGHTAGVRAVAWSPDGRFIVSGSYDKTLRLWNAHTGEAVGEPMEGHEGLVLAVAYSPDGVYIASGSEDRTVRRWRAETGEAVGVPMEGHTSAVNAVAYSPDGQHIVSGSNDHTLRLWDAVTGAAIGGPMKGHTDWVHAVAWSPDGRFIVSGSDDKTLRRWDPQTGDAVGEPMEGHDDWIRCVACSPDSRYAISGSHDKTIRQWNLLTGRAVGEPMIDHIDSVTAVTYTPDGLHIISSDGDRLLRRWAVQTEDSGGMEAQGQTYNINAVAVSPDGRCVLSGSDDGILRQWDVSTGEAVGRPMEGHTHSVQAVAYSSDSRYIVSGSADGTLRRWNPRTGAAVGQPMTGHTRWIRAVACSPDHRLIVSGSDDKTLQRWDADTGQPVGGPMEGHTDWIRDVAFSLDGQQIVSGSDDHTLRRWDATTGVALGEPMRGHTAYVLAVAFSPDGRLIVSGSTDRTVRRWDARTGEAVGKPMNGHTEKVRAVACSADGSCIISGSSDQTLRLWKTHTGSAIGEPRRLHCRVLTVAWLRDNHHIVFGQDNILTVSDIHTLILCGSALPALLSQHSRVLSCTSPANRSITCSEVAAIAHHPTVGSELLADGDVNAARWTASCFNMKRDASDGWVKDKEVLLFWVPPTYRHNFRYLAKVLIGTQAKRVTPTVDFTKLLECINTDWTKIYTG